MAIPEFGTQPIQCAKRACTWRGFETQLAKKRDGDFTTHLCPRCGHDSYQFLTQRQIGLHKKRTGVDLSTPHKAEKPLYYMQDTRTTVGNDMLFWAIDNQGYTTDLRKARVWTEEEARRQAEGRGTDRPWRKDYIDARTRPAVDFQHCDVDFSGVVGGLING